MAPGRLKMGPVPVLEVVDTLLNCGLLSACKVDAECPKMGLLEAEAPCPAWDSAGFFTRLRIQRRLRTKSRTCES